MFPFVLWAEPPKTSNQGKKLPVVDNVGFLRWGMSKEMVKKVILQDLQTNSSIWTTLRVGDLAMDKPIVLDSCTGCSDYEVFWTEEFIVFFYGDDYGGRKVFWRRTYHFLGDKLFAVELKGSSDFSMAYMIQVLSIMYGAPSLHNKDFSLVNWKATDSLGRDVIIIAQQYFGGFAIYAMNAGMRRVAEKCYASKGKKLK